MGGMDIVVGVVILAGVVGVGFFIYEYWSFLFGAGKDAVNFLRPVTTLGCPSGKVNDAGLCYPPCPSGTTGVATMCVGSCPSGWKDTGLTCVPPNAGSYGRGAGKVPALNSCPSGYTKSGAMCYQCPSGPWELKGALCEAQCPSGFKDGTAGFCTGGGSWTKPADRSSAPSKTCPSGYTMDNIKSACYKCVSGGKYDGMVGCWDGALAKPAPSRKSLQLSCPQYMSLHDGTCYHCPTGYEYSALGVCHQRCPDGFPSNGTQCAKPAPKVPKQVTLKQTCDSGWELDADGLCYPACRSGYHGVGPVCWMTCPSGFTQQAGFCGKKTTDRGAGTAISACPASYPEKIGALCYGPCPTGFTAKGVSCIPNSGDKPAM